MDGFLENPLLFLIEDAEPILPILRSARYNPDSRKIVELTDVGCDTETTYPVHFPRGAFERRRGGAENFESIRGFAKWRDERPKNFPARMATARDHHFSGRNENRVGRRARRNNRVYDDAYIASDLDYDSLVEDFLDDLKLAGRNDSTLGYKRGYYNEYRDPWNTIGRSRKESPVRDTRYNYSEDFESRKYDEQTENQRENIYSCWFADNDKRNVHGACDIDARSRLSPSNYFRKRTTKIRTRIDEDFNRDAEYEKHHGMPKRHEREDVFLDIAADSVAPTKDDFWDFISSENEPTREETSFSKSARVKDRGHRSRTTSRGRGGSRNLDSWRKYVHVNDTGKMNNIAETREKQNSENLSPIENARYQISRDNDGEIWRSNLLNANPPRMRSARISNDEQLPDNIRPTGRAYTRLRSAVEHRKASINSSTSTEKREEPANSTSSRTKAHRRSRDKFGYGATVKLFDKPFGQAGRPTKIPRLIIADSKNNERTYTVNKEDDVNRRAEVSARDTKADRADRNSLSRSIFERATGDEGTSASNRVFRITSVSPSTETERRKKRKCSRLPVRTWKRVRTREPTALRLKSDVTVEALHRGLRVTDVVHRETARPSNQSGQARIDEVLPNETIASGGANGDNVVRNDRYGTRSVGTAKSRLTSINPKDLKRTECDSKARNGRNARASRTGNKRQ